MRPIKTCVLGVGLSGLTFHVPFVLALPDLFDLYAVLERNPTSEGGKVKARFDVNVKIYRTFEEVVSDADIELVIVGTPNQYHYQHVKGALEAGKHVLVDKPVTPTSAEAAELGELAKSKNLILYAYQNRRWDSDFLTLRKLLDVPRSSPHSIGDLVEFESHYDRYRAEPKGDWKEADLPGSGQLFNLGSHLIDQVVALFGRPASVTGFVANVRGLGHPEVDDTFTVILQYPINEELKYPLTVLLRCHILSARSPQLRFVVRGTKGAFVKHGLDVQEDQLKTMSQPEFILDPIFGQEPHDIIGTVEHADDSGNITKTKWPTENGAYIDLFENLAAAIRKGDALKVKWEEVVTVLEIIETAHRSSKEGRTINL